MEAWPDEKGGNCTPSAVRAETGSSEFGKKILGMKRVIEEYIDNVVIPESSLEKLRAFRKNAAHENVDAMLLKTG